MVRVQELAAELAVPSSKVLEILKAYGSSAKGVASEVSDAEANKVRAALKSKSTTTSRVSGKRDFRVRDISAPAKSPSIRPRPAMQQSESAQAQRIVTRKVVKRVVRRVPSTKEGEPAQPEISKIPPPVPEVPVVEQAPQKLEDKANVQAETPVVTPTVKPAVEKEQKRETPPPPKKEKQRPSVPKKDTSERPQQGQGPRRDDQRRGGSGGGGGPRRERDSRDRGGRSGSGGGRPGGSGRDDRGGSGRGGGGDRDHDLSTAKRPEQKYAPVGKTGGGRDSQNRPPKPKVPRIPNPEDYLKPKEAEFARSMEKLAAGGLKTSIDTSRGKGRRPVADSDKTGKGGKRRRKIIKDDKRAKPPVVGGRGRSTSVRAQVQSQLDTSSTIRKRGKGFGKARRDRMEMEVKSLPKKIRLGEHVSIKELSAQTGLKSSEIISFLMKELEIFASINMTVDQEIAGLICDHFHFECDMQKVIQIEDVLKHEEDLPEDLVPRPPVVTVLGHVDHGKTKLLDAIRGTDVVATEAGGITQKIGAFQVATKVRDGSTRAITFIDTPGHAAFTAMRARGAQVTDIAVLVVAANDGVMPQTLEAIDHARSAGVEIMVAINKIDLPEANPERVKQQLAELGLVPEEWGGRTIMVPISAKKKINIEDLLEQLGVVADVLELKGHPSGMAEGAIIEARLDKGRGALATVLVKRGTLNVGDYVVAGRSWGKIRQMTDEDGTDVVSAGPSMPVLISGLNTVPAAGDTLNELEDEKTARGIYEKREMDHRQGRLKMVNAISLETFYQQLSKGETKELNIILKADLQGSIEALRGQLEQLSTDEVGVKFIHTAVGNINDSDIMLAMASKAVILGFNVVASPEIRKQAEMEKVEIMTYNIIYKAVEDIQAALEGMLEPEYRENIIGRAEVREVFKKTSRMVVAGAIVNEGRMVRGATVRIMRDGEKVTELQLANLKRFKDDVKEVENGYEFGLMLEGFNDLREKDEIIAFETIKILRTLKSSHKTE